MRDGKWSKSNYSEHSLKQGPFISCKKPRTSKCDARELKGATSQIAKARTQSLGSHIVHHNCDQVVKGKKTIQLKCEHTRPGCCVSAEYCIFAVTGHLPYTDEREQHKYQAGTLFVDHVSGKVFNFCQLSTGAADIVVRKHALECYRTSAMF